MRSGLNDRLIPRRAAAGGRGRTSVWGASSPSNLPLNQHALSYVTAGRQGSPWSCSGPHAAARSWPCGSTGSCPVSHALGAASRSALGDRSRHSRADQRLGHCVPRPPEPLVSHSAGGICCGSVPHDVMGKHNRALVALITESNETALQVSVSAASSRRLSAADPGAPLMRAAASAGALKTCPGMPAESA